MPGVHAYAAAGVTAIAMNAMPTAHSRKTAGCLTDSRPNLDTDPLPLTADCFSEIVHLRANDIVDCFACTVHVFANGIRHFINGNRFDQLASAISRGAEALGSSLTGPSCAITAPIGSPASSW